MIFYSHRGNLYGPKPELENQTEYIETSINGGFNVEIDLRVIGEDLFLGHDFPQYKTSRDWIEQHKEHLLIHVKNFNALSLIVKHNFDWHFFCHNNDSFTVTSKSYIWLHDMGRKPDRKTIVPLLTKELVDSYDWYCMYGICSDYIAECNKFMKG